MFGLYISFDAEFNADSEFVHVLWVYFISKGLLGQKPCFWDIFWVFMVLWANQAGYGKNVSRFGISVKN